MIFERRIILILLFVFFAFSFYCPFFIVLIPFLVPQKINLHSPFKIGWLCGIFFFSIHMFGFLWVSIHNGLGIVRFLYPSLLFIYCGFYTGLWFYFLKKIGYFSVWPRRGGRLLITFLYFWFVHSGILFILVDGKGTHLRVRLFRW